MAAVRLIRGDTWTRAWILRRADGSVIDLSGAMVRLQVRDSDGAVVMSASQSDGRIVIDGPAGRIDLIMPYAATEVAPGTYRYDLEVTYPGGMRRTYEQQTLVVVEDVTR